MNANLNQCGRLGTHVLMILLMGMSLLSVSCNTTALDGQEKSIPIKISLPGAHPQFLEREYVVPIERKIFGLGIASRLRSNAGESEVRIVVDLRRGLTVRHGEEQIRRIVSELFADREVDKLAIEVFVVEESE